MIKIRTANIITVMLLVVYLIVAISFFFVYLEKANDWKFGLIFIIPTVLHLVAVFFVQSLPYRTKESREWDRYFKEKAKKERERERQMREDRKLQKKIKLERKQEKIAKRNTRRVLTSTSR